MYVIESVPSLFSLWAGARLLNRTARGQVRSRRLSQEKVMNLIWIHTGTLIGIHSRKGQVAKPIAKEGKRSMKGLHCRR